MKSSKWPGGQVAGWKRTFGFSVVVEITRQEDPVKLQNGRGLEDTARYAGFLLAPALLAPSKKRAFYAVFAYFRLFQKYLKKI